jgi:nicotinate-nucleotide adenylyltransferase
MRVGLFGGSFNPAHEGHQHVSQTAIRRLGLDRVIWLVSPQNPLKSSRDTASLADRLAGARRVAQGPKVVVSDIETRLGSQYTIDTLRLLKARYPGVHFVWLMGGDNLASFHRWRGWTQIMGEVPVAVVARPGPRLNGSIAPAAHRFAHARVGSSRARGLALMAAPAWVYLRARLNFASSTALRAGLSHKAR